MKKNDIVFELVYIILKAVEQSIKIQNTPMGKQAIVSGDNCKEMLTLAKTLEELGKEIYKKWLFLKGRKTKTCSPPKVRL